MPLALLLCLAMPDCNLPWWAGHNTRIIPAIAISRDPSVACDQHAFAPGEAGQPSERTEPPDRPPQLEHCLGAPGNSSIGCQEFHFFQRIARTQSETSHDPGCLQRQQFKSAPPQPRLDHSCEADTQVTIGIIGDPRGRLSATIIWNFGIHRNTYLKFLSAESQ